MNESAGWYLPSPHVIALAVTPAETDAYNHVNNAVYLTWFDRAAWDHSAALGLPLTRCLELDRGMAVVRAVVTYLRPALSGDEVLVATWLVPGNSRLTAVRRFEVRRAGDDEALARAEITYACIELSSGRPTRWPAEFRDQYVVRNDVESAYAALPPL
jgi:acyl-CoA thioester hydrolase